MPLIVRKDHRQQLSDKINEQCFDFGRLSVFGYGKLVYALTHLLFVCLFVWVVGSLLY